jgi:hypothetical protein
MLTEIEKINEKAVRNAYHVAEIVDIPGWVNSFTADGTFTDESTNTTFQGEKQLGEIVVIFKTAFPDMHRELFRVFPTGDMVIVELALQGTQNGPLRMHLPKGVLPPTGKRMDAPCCDVPHGKRQDQVVPLLSVASGDAGAARRALEHRGRALSFLVATSTLAYSPCGAR